MIYQNLFLISPNRETGYYEIPEYNNLYQLNETSFINLKAFFKKYHVGTISEWYEVLSDEDKKKVIITTISETSTTFQGF